MKKQNSAIRYIQQIRHPTEKAPFKMPFENNGTLQKWHMTNTPPKTNKYDTRKNGALQKWHTLQKNAQRLFAKD